MNEYDSARLLDGLSVTCGIEVVDSEEEADVLLLNTCSVREKAQEKVFSQLGRWRKLKLKNPDIVIGVGGCVASQEGAAIRTRAPYVDLIWGPQTLHRLPEMLGEVWAHHRAVVDVSFPEIEKFDKLPVHQSDGPSAFVSIMEGCSKYCTFCVVPYTRGEEVSRPFDDVIAEIAGLAAQGVREVNLLGQNVNAYRGEMDAAMEGGGRATHGAVAEAGTADLALLIHYVAAIDGIDRIRYTTSHPVELSESLIAAYSEVPELVSFLHLPVQSGADRILTQMKRGHTALEYKSKIRKLRQARPNMPISSDFIVGFPGETETDFEATMQLIKEIGFDFSYSFIYSPRPGTPAADLPDDVPLKVKKARLARLQEQITSQARAISAAMVGRVEQVLVERISHRNEHQLSGRTENNRVVNFDGEAALIGQFVPVRITEARPNSLQGELVTD
jgi:tRNA-2-methylthio-N6-dimethylallyladenosine synthase